MQQDFKILQKTYDMILYGNICLKQFPKSERYALAADIKNLRKKLCQTFVFTKGGDSMRKNTSRARGDTYAGS